MESKREKSNASMSRLLLEEYSQCSDLRTLQLLRQSRRRLFRIQPFLEFTNERDKFNFHTLLFRVSFRKTHFLDADFAGLKFFFTQDDAEGDAALFGGFELLR